LAQGRLLVVGCPLSEEESVGIATSEQKKALTIARLSVLFCLFTHYMQLTTPVLVLLFLLGERHEYRSGSSAE